MLYCIYTSCDLSGDHIYTLLVALLVSFIYFQESLVWGEYSLNEEAASSTGDDRSAYLYGRSLLCSVIVLF